MTVGKLLVVLCERQLLLLQSMYPVTHTCMPMVPLLCTANTEWNTEAVLYFIKDITHPSKEGQLKPFLTPLNLQACIVINQY